ncbi:MAG: leucine-rich repeat domain-containing protein, partial [Bacteroidales bacterium]|nr:leucine-rich repeat domain-containing protein [Bacteroidales bacterium]
MLISGATTIYAQETWNIGAAANPGGAASVTATLDGNTLTISGAGAMATFTTSDEINTTAPWNDVRSDIHTVIINEGITVISRLAFYLCSNLTSVTIPHSVTEIDRFAFQGTALPSVVF